MWGTESVRNPAKWSDCPSWPGGAAALKAQRGGGSITKSSGCSKHCTGVLQADPKILLCSVFVSYELWSFLHGTWTTTPALRAAPPGQEGRFASLNFQLMYHGCAFRRLLAVLHQHPLLTI